MLVATPVGLEDFEKILIKGGGEGGGVLKIREEIDLKWGE